MIVGGGPVPTKPLADSAVFPTLGLMKVPEQLTGPGTLGSKYRSIPKGLNPPAAGLQVAVYDIEGNPVSVVGANPDVVEDINPILHDIERLTVSPASPAPIAPFENRRNWLLSMDSSGSIDALVSGIQFITCCGVFPIVRPNISMTIRDDIPFFRAIKKGEVLNFMCFFINASYYFTKISTF